VTRQRASRDRAGRGFPKQVGGNDEAADGTEAPRGRVEME